MVKRFFHAKCNAGSMRRLPRNRFHKSSDTETVDSNTSQDVEGLHRRRPETSVRDGHPPRKNKNPCTDYAAQGQIQPTTRTQLSSQFLRSDDVTALFILPGSLAFRNVDELDVKEELSSSQGMVGINGHSLFPKSRNQDRHGLTIFEA